MKKVIESTVFKALQIIIAAAALVFGAFAPASEKAAAAAFLTALAVSAISMIYDFVIKAKKKKIPCAEFFVLIAAVGLFAAGERLQAGVSLLVFVIYRYAQKLVVPEMADGEKLTSGMVPDKALVFREGKETVIDASELETGNIAIVKEGERIPADSRVFMGDATVELSSFPGDFDEIKTVRRDRVPAGGTVCGGTIQVEVIKPLKDSYISRCAERIGLCADSRGKGEDKTRKAEWVITVLFAIAAILIGLVPPLGFGEDYMPWICAALIIFAGSSFGDVVETVRRTELSAIQALDRKGIFPESIATFEKAARTDRVMVEKALRLGEGTYSVHHIKNIDCGKEEMLTFAAHLSIFADQPEDRAIVDAYMQMARYEGISEASALRKSLVSGFEHIEDKGLSGHIGGRFVCIGSADMMKLLNINEIEEEDGYRLIHVACNQRYMGYIALEYAPDSSADAVYNAWADAGIIKYAVFGEDIEGIYEELRESKSEKDRIFAVERNAADGALDRSDILTVKIGCGEKFTMPDNAAFVMTSDRLEALAYIKNTAVKCRKKSIGKALTLWIVRIAAFTAAGLGVPFWAAIAAAGAIDIILNIKQ